MYVSICTISILMLPVIIVTGRERKPVSFPRIAGLFSTVFKCLQQQPLMKQCRGTRCGEGS